MALWPALHARRHLMPTQVDFPWRFFTGEFSHKLGIFQTFLLFFFFTFLHFLPDSRTQQVFKYEPSIQFLFYSTTAYKKASLVIDYHII